MPALTTGSKSLLPFHSHICEQQWSCSRLAISLIIFTIVLAVISLFRQIGKQRFPKRLLCMSSAEQDVTRTPKAPYFSIKPNFLFVSDCWVQLKQGQGPFEKRANRASVSRGGASGTAELVGLGGPRERGQMEEEERVSAGSRSRGVSKYWSDGSRLSGARGLPLSDQLPVSAEQGGHVGPSRGEGTADQRGEHKNMQVSHFGGFGGVKIGTSSGPIQESRGLISKSLLGGHMADDEHIFYGSKDVSSFHDPIRSQKSLSPKPLTPPASADGIYPALATHAEHQEGIAIPSRSATALHLVRNSSNDGFDGKDEAVHSSQEDGASSSSYPPTSPLLPPPPPTTAHEAFDPAVIMFPGPARDGGIRVVPPHRHGELAPSSTQVTSSSHHPGASWSRHTRVYGGGVCLACAAAAGDGGFYGDSVRPEDKR